MQMKVLTAYSYTFLAGSMIPILHSESWHTQEIKQLPLHYGFRTQVFENEFLEFGILLSTY